MFISKYKLKITGKDVKRFIRKLYNSGIFFDEIDIHEKYAYIKVDEDNYKKILNIKTIYEIKLIQLYGLTRVLDIVIRYKSLLICLFIGLCYFLFLSCIIFNVEVIHSKKDIRNLLYSELKYYGIEKYKFVKSFNKKEYIENKILENHKDKIEWIEIERIGVKYVVRVEERVIKSPSVSKTPRNIVAKKDGIILNIDAYKGEVNKKVGDYVKKGETIISGLITKNNKIKNRVPASGNIYAEVWYKTDVSMPYYYNEVNYLGYKRKTLKLKVLNNEYNMFSFKKFDTFKEKVFFSLKNNILPISLDFVEEEKTSEIEKIYSTEEAITEAKKISFKKMKSKLKENEKILSDKILEVHEYENYVNVVLFYKVYENIGIEEKITEEYVKEFELNHKD